MGPAHEKLFTNFGVNQQTIQPVTVNDKQNLKI